MREELHERKTGLHIGGGMSLWGRRSASLVDVVQKRRKLVSMNIPELREKMSTDFYLLHLIAAEIRSGQCCPVMAERIGIKR